MQSFKYIMAGALSSVDASAAGYVSADNNQVHIGPMTVDLEPINKELGYWDKYFDESADTIG